MIRICRVCVSEHNTSRSSFKIFCAGAILKGGRESAETRFSLMRYRDGTPPPAVLPCYESVCDEEGTGVVPLWSVAFQILEVFP